MNFQVMIDPKKCTGCGTCELACSLYNKRECNPEKSRTRVIRYEDEGILYSVPVICQQCEKPICQKVCPTGAISRDRETGAWVVDQSRCMGCRSCVNACPFGGVSMDQEQGVSVKCDLCGGEPKCVEFCPTEALSFVRQDKASILRKREGVEGYLDHLKSVLRPSVG